METSLSNGKNPSNKPPDFSRGYNGSGLSWTAVVADHVEVMEAVLLLGKQRRRDGLLGITGDLGTFITIGERISSAAIGLPPVENCRKVSKIIVGVRLCPAAEFLTAAGPVSRL
jgi:hypothetical protein